ncbi:Ig-like domain-containing protein, partial [Pseudactinotalea sp.]|uniref:Ig-like domain-containing protein n=1 Tax=Pseudactinotalea sp. TaxID=1926260 RepID=UPI003B3AC3B9
MRPLLRRSALVFLLVAIGALAQPPQSQAASTECADESCEVVFTTGGAPESFTVPAGVSSISVTVSGAAGGNVVVGGTLVQPGGRGGSSTATFTVEPGDRLTVLVGGVGEQADFSAGAAGGSGATPRSGGFGGGGTAGSAGLWSAAGGGGGSYLFSESGELLLAAGGGGGAASGSGSAGAGVGVGGGVSGSAGAGVSAGSDAAGAGGTGTGGGEGANGGGPTTSPLLVGAGGSGGVGGAVSGAGGGGGYYGGGGGSGSPSVGAGVGGPGGGGSGYAAPSAEEVSGTAGTQPGEGRIVISYVRALPSVQLSAVPGPTADLGEPVTYTLTLGGPAGTPGGSASFSWAGSGCESVPVSDVGVAQCTLTDLTGGSHAVTVSYSGSTIYRPVSVVWNQVVERGEPDVELSVDATTATPLETVTFTAQVTGLPMLAPTGSFDFSVGATPIEGCQGVPVQSDGTAECSSSTIGVGAHTLTAAYSGDESYQPATGEAEITIEALIPGIGLSADPDQGEPGAPLTLTAVVTGDEMPTGTVQFTRAGVSIEGCE